MDDFKLLNAIPTAFAITLVALSPLLYVPMTDGMLAGEPHLITMDRQSASPAMTKMGRLESCLAGFERTTDGSGYDCTRNIEEACFGLYTEAQLLVTALPRTLSYVCP